MKTRCGIVVVLLVLTAMLVAAVPTVAPAATSLNPYEQQLLTLINKERAKKGLRCLRLNAKLVTSARAHSGDMAESKYFEHNSPSGEAWSKRIIRCGYKRTGYRYWKAGENIYYGAGLYSSPVLVVDAWMGSPGHRRVIMTKVFRDIGVGAVKTDTGYGSFDGVVWFFTLDLGRRIAK